MNTRLVLALLILFAVACRGPGPAVPEASDPTSEAALPAASDTPAQTATAATTATRTPRPTSTSTPGLTNKPTLTPAEPETPTPTPSPVPTEAGFAVATVPYWISISYPADWQPLAGENEGAIAFGSQAVSLDSSDWPDSIALFFVSYIEGDDSDPLAGLEAYAGNLNEETEIFEEPARVEGVGQTAASMRYSWPGQRDRLFVTEVTYAVDENGRMAVLLATANVDGWDTVAPTFVDNGHGFSLLTAGDGRFRQRCSHPPRRA